MRFEEADGFRFELKNTHGVYIDDKVRNCSLWSIIFYSLTYYNIVVLDFILSHSTEQDLDHR